MWKGALALLILLFAAPLPVVARVELPVYAQSSGLHSELEHKGHEITRALSLLVAILSIIGILTGAGHFAVGNGERGRSYVLGGVIALLLATSVYAIVSLIVS